MIIMTMTTSSVTASMNVGDLQTDTEFDAYWEEEARNPHRNRIRIGRQYQATIPPKLKSGEGDGRQLEKVETISWRIDHGLSEERLDDYFFESRALGLLARFKAGKPKTTENNEITNDKNGLSPSSSSSSSPKNGICSQTEQTSSSPNNNNTRSNPKNKKDSSSKIESKGNNSKTVDGELIAMSNFVQGYHPNQHDDACTGNDSEAKTDKWSLNEARLFSHALETYGKNFGAIKKALTWKPAKNIIEHYYKKSGGGDGSGSSGHDDGSGDENMDSINSPGEDDGGSGNNNNNNNGNNTSNSINPKGNYSQTLQVACFTSTQTTGPIISDHKDLSSSSTPFASIKLHDSLKMSGLLPSDNHFNGLNTKQASIDHLEEHFLSSSDSNITGAEVKALKAKPIFKSEESDQVTNGSNSVLGSLKFFMDGQLVLKLNAKQQEMESKAGSSSGKCQWVESHDTPKVKKGMRNKRYTKHKPNDTMSLDSTGKTLTNESSGSSGRASVVSEDTGEEEESSDDDVSLGSSESRSLPSPSLAGMTPRKGSISGMSSSSRGKNEINSHVSSLLSKCSSPVIVSGDALNKTPKNKEVKRDFSVFAFEDDTPAPSSSVSRSPLGSPGSLVKGKASLSLSGKKRFKTGLSNGSSPVFSRPDDRSNSLGVLRNHAPLSSSSSHSALDLSSPKVSTQQQQPPPLLSGQESDSAVDLTVNRSASSTTTSSKKSSPDRRGNHHNQDKR